MDRPAEPILQGPADGCLHCGKSDHFSRNCPQRPNYKCANCKREGHRQESCPEPEQPVVIRCFACKKEGHKRDGCPQNRLRNVGFGNRTGFEQGAGGSGAPPLRCTVCEGRGHHASVCPSVGVLSGQSLPHEPNPPSFSHPNRGPDQRKAAGDTRKPKSVGVIKTLVSISDAYTAARNEPGENFGHDRKYNVKISDHTFEGEKLQNFQQANLDDSLMDVIQKMKFECTTPIQSYAIPVINEGRDLLATCETGSGKTGAFLLPIVDKLIRLNERPSPGKLQSPLAVVVVPTRELAVQLVKDAKSLLRRSPIEAKECYGGTDFNKERSNIQRGTQLLIGTLGRIMHFVREKIIAFDRLRFLVLDEADQMLSPDFHDGVTRILDLARGPKPQVLMFSATFPTSVLEIAEKYLKKDHVKVVVGLQSSANVNVAQRVKQVRGSEKHAVLEKVLQEALEEDPNAKIMVFVERKVVANRLEELLAATGKFKCSSLHSDKMPVEREKAMAEFQNGVLNVLVATSVAARGLDIKRVTHVINYDLPREIEEYINRIGRTGRVGNRGSAVAFFDPKTDAHLAVDLRNCLFDAGIEPPHFLL